MAEQPEINGMETQSTMPAKTAEVEKMPSIQIDMYKMEITPTQLRQYFAPKDATSADIGFFIAMAKSLGLNPWKREIHMVPFYDTTGVRKYAPVVGYEVYLNRAEMSNKLDGWATEFDDEAAPTKCTITIWRKDWSHEFTHTTYMDEVMRTKRDGEPMATWATQPRFQLKKCTIAQGMRMCIPECAGLPYTFEEQAIIEHDTSQAMPIDLPEIESAQAEPETFDKAQARKRQDYPELVDVAKEKDRMEAELGKEEPSVPPITAAQKNEIRERADALGFGNLSGPKFQKWSGEILDKLKGVDAMTRDEAASIIIALDAEVDRQAAEETHDSQ